MKIALISPSRHASSETFIQQHKKHISGEVIHYYNGNLPKNNDLCGALLTRNKNILFRIKKKFNLSNFTANEQALIASFKKEKINIVIAEYGQTGVAVLNVCKFLNISVIPIFHGYDASIKSILLKYAKGYKLLFDYSKRVIAVSDKIKETLVGLGCDPKKIVVTPCAPDDSFFDLKPSFDSQIFFGVGRFVNKKAPYYTIMSFKKVLSEFPEAKLMLAGDGPLYNMCSNLVKYYKLEQSVKLLGIVTPEQVKQNLIKAIGYVQHSIVTLEGDSEGTPVAVLEASAAGLPVISTFHGGISHVVINNETGLLVAEHDVDQMAEKMVFILKNISRSKEMGTKGREFVGENFSREIHIGHIDRAIKEVLYG
ncbi:glycosyltransferase [Algibacter mikhailovii]|uniref:glycosyltransferase n=1 Tax=Algibacter mikhailovii TaxID=425498 RepID=UPI0024954F29|nr:glycosyltransferase [Algibacter mikhailovii]